MSFFSILFAGVTKFYPRSGFIFRDDLRSGFISSVMLEESGELLLSSVVPCYSCYELQCCRPKSAFSITEPPILSL